MTRLLAALLLSLPSTAFADALAGRYEAAVTGFDRAMLSAYGSNPAGANWSPERRRASLCALATLEKVRGRAVAEAYVREYAAAAAQAAQMGRRANFGQMLAQVHARSGISAARDAAPIARACGIGL